MAEAALKAGVGQRLNLRRNWPAIYAGIAILLMSLTIVDSSRWWPYPPPQREIIPYVLLFFRHTLSNYLIVLVCPLSLLALIGATLTTTKRNWSLARLILLAYLCWGLFTFLSLFGPGTTLEHLDTEASDGHVYHLIYRYWGESVGILGMEYLVYECDATNTTCATINEIEDTSYRMSSGRARRSAHFQIDPTDNILYIELTDGRTTERHRATG
jgi:hypothetical protein